MYYVVVMGMYVLCGSYGYVYVVCGSYGCVCTMW